MLIHWIWLATRAHLSDREKLAVLSRFRDPEDIFYADGTSYRETEGLSEEALASLEDKDLHPAGGILRTCMDQDIRVCTFHDGAYPAALKNIADPPLVLYCRGKLPDLDGSPVIAVVGTRKASVYGINAAKRIGAQLARCGAVVVSGLAAGIDGAGIAGALTAGGCAVGVLGCGVDVVYPLSNRSLFEDTLRYGCLISEFPPGTPPLRWNFPKRNRIISGISDGVLVVEAPERSGALITARQAADQGRDVFAVPGNVDVPTCEGSNALLREGAIAARNGWDVLSEYLALYPDRIRRDNRTVRPAGFTADVTEEPQNPEKPEPKVAQKPVSPAKGKVSDKKKAKKPVDNGSPPPYSDNQSLQLSGEEEQIVSLLRAGERLVDDVIHESGLPTARVLSLLTLLEIRGVVVRRPGKRVALK